jgi:hypothetical protein
MLGKINNGQKECTPSFNLPPLINKLEISFTEQSLLVVIVNSGIARA